MARNTKASTARSGAIPAIEIRPRVLIESLGTIVRLVCQDHQPLTCCGATKFECNCSPTLESIVRKRSSRIVAAPGGGIREVLHLVDERTIPESRRRRQPFQHSPDTPDQVCGELARPLKKWEHAKLRGDVPSRRHRIIPGPICSYRWHQSDLEPFPSYQQFGALRGQVFAPVQRRSLQPLRHEPFC